MTEAKEKIKEELRQFASECISHWMGVNVAEYIERYANQILALDEIAVVDRSAELPSTDWSDGDLKRGWDIAQKFMRKEGWVKEIKS